MNIRKAEPKDAKRIAALLVTIAQLHHAGRPDLYGGQAKYDLTQVEKMLADPDKIIFVAANEQNDVLGYIIAYPIERHLPDADEPQYTLYIDDLCVDSACRGNGIGKALLLFMRDYAKDNQFFNVELNVWTFNKDAVRFYERCGMTEQRRRMEFRF